MQEIELDGSSWTERLDFWLAVRDALGVVPGHGTGFAAFEDSVFYHPDMLTVRPPFAIMVRNVLSLSQKDIEQMAKGWAYQRKWRRETYGDDVEASLTVIP